jgi:hypothetical protein
MSELADEVLGLTLKKGFEPLSKTAVEQALKSPNAVEALRALGVRANDAKVIASRASGLGAKSVAAAATSEAATAAAKEGTKTGFKGFVGKLLSGAKGNFVVAGVFSLATNAIQLAQGQINIAQFLGLSVVDTAAYGAIGWGSAAAGAALGTAIFPGFGTAAGFVIGLGLGVLGGSIYEKVLRNPLKGLLGAGGGASDGGYRTGTTGAPGPTGPSSTGYQVAQPTPGVDLTYEEALRQIDRMGTH